MEAHDLPHHEGTEHPGSGARAQGLQTPSRTLLEECLQAEQVPRGGQGPTKTGRGP